MIRYTKQRDEADCGPTAIVNALKWAGNDISYRDVGASKIAAELCGYWVGGGVPPAYLDSALEKVGLLLWYKTNPTLDEVEGHIRSGGACIINFARRSRPRRHYVFVPEVTSDGKFFTIVNEYSGKGIKAATKSRRYDFKRKIMHRMRRPIHLAGYDDIALNIHLTGVWFLTRPE